MIPSKLPVTKLSY